ncbi:hypothetical protein AG1IA_10463 [Rhizoctonia solani AG-1 IA]|uniref:Ricin B lectin domain-containing protein n=1 Tax=Thanatephorus cucumeris (strain AG1-IA) TaxID=983506 RepID=L8WFL6_THACA|nr:hypothetical protein AG1IA_10463 [Rhizoctonia solani AG-1 IA]
MVADKGYCILYNNNATNNQKWNFHKV